MNQNEIIVLNIKDLFSGSSLYQIPIYQRNYAWKEKEISQLIQDIADCVKINKNRDYHIGTLVVFDRKEGDSEVVFETIDGQQRLTTMVLLLSVLKREHLNSDNGKFSWFDPQLGFDSRESSTETLQYLISERKLDARFFSHQNPELYDGFLECSRSLKRIIKEEKIPINEFVSFLLQNVKIVRVSVPPGTDLNHYFEIMNSRGEQLEKHEILKARFLEILQDEEAEISRTFNLIWESCANMERYIQYGFEPKQREILFGPDWDRFLPLSIEEVAKGLFPNENQADFSSRTGVSILEILDKNKHPVFRDKTDSQVRESESERFTSPINFQNFLLQVLRIQAGKVDDIPLDDKRLLESFEKYFNGKKGTVKSFAKEFGYNLLRAKFLLDRYVLKREYTNNQDRWSLKKLVRTQRNDTNVKYINSFGEEDISIDKYKYNQKILMLLSMFHVSAPTQIYKHWLSGVLQYLTNQEKIQPMAYRNFLEKLGASFLFDRYLAKEGKQREFHHIIFSDIVGPKNTLRRIEWENLNRGTDVENFVFNFLDYQIWKRNRKANSSFEFSFRSSVEHYYPQNPFDGFPRLDQKTLDNFGNLCLISGERNSRLSNLMPSGKRDHYKASPTIDSLKQRLMMEHTEWGKKQINDHGDEMVNYFKVLLETPMEVK
jgi:hypothetical protein